MTERLFQMTRLRAGDYLLPGNDERTLWRIQRYEDGAACGLDVDYELRPFWRLLRCRYEVAAVAGGADWTEDDAWVEVHSWLPTRQAAIDSAMESDAHKVSR